MEQSELNKELLEAIDKKVHTQSTAMYQKRDAAKECERICLQFAVGILSIIENNNGVYSARKSVIEAREELQQQLNQLKQ